MQNLHDAPLRQAQWRPSRSFSITVAIWLLLLIIFTLTGVLGVWLVLFALFGILSALYALIFGRRSWVGLPHRKAAGVAVGAGIATLVLGIIVTGVTVPASFAGDRVETSATASPSPTPSPTSILLDDCVDDGASSTQLDGVYICTPDDGGFLVWMTEDESKAVLADRSAATAKAEADKAAADKAAAQKAAAKKAAADKAAADRAAADEAARVAAENAAQQPAPVVQPAPAPIVQAPAPAPVVQAPPAPAPAPAAYYANCTAARAAGAAPIYAGQPGYRAALDRDHDGVACEN